MNILMIDDSEERIKLLSNIYQSHSIIATEDYNTVKQALNSKAIDLIHLDYDLSDTTSEEIANLILESDQKPIIIIHSDNPDGAKILKTILSDALIIPISQFTNKSNQLSHYKALASSGSIITRQQITDIFKLI